MTEATPAMTNAVTAQQAAGALTIKPMSIKDTVLAQFKDTEVGLTAMAEKYRDVVYDVTTPKGMKEAKEARADLRDNGRRMLTRTEASVKADVNELKKVMGDEVERLVAIVRPVEDAIDAQIKAEEKRKTDEKAENDRIEAERVGAHRANIDQLKEYAEKAEGQPVDTIENAIKTLGAMTFGAEWEEFAQEAEAACLATVQRLLTMAENEKRRIENERLQKELDEARAALAAKAQPPSPVAPPAAETAPAPVADPLVFEVEPWEEPATGAQTPTAAPVDALAPARQRVTAWTEARRAPAETATPVVQATPSLKLGAIEERLGFPLSAAFLRTLGFEPAAKVGAHGVYDESQYPQILAALAAHIADLQTKAAA